MRDEYMNDQKYINRIRELEIELAEQRLSAKLNWEDKKLYDFLVNNIPDIIFKLNRFGKIVFMNRAVKAYGYEPEELIGRDILEFIHPDDKERVKRRIKERRSGDRRTRNLEVRIFVNQEKNMNTGEWERLTTRTPTFSISTRGVYSSVEPKTETFLGTLGIARDITQRLNLEEQNLQMQKMDALGRLSGEIAHDFNNILTAIVGNTELALKSTSSDCKIHKRLTSILDACQRAKEMISQVLTFSSKNKQEKKPVLLNSIIRESLKLLGPTIPSNIQFIQYVDREDALVCGNPSQFQQVVMNLCINALHAMRGKRGKLSVQLENVDVDDHSAKKYLDLHEGPYSRLSVSDSGEGMDKKTMKRIFEPYFSTKPEGEGTGLGLSVVHGIVKSLKGAIKIYSEIGKGTTFQVFFPRVVKKKKNIKPGSTNIGPSDTETFNAKGAGHILLVDDEPLILNITKDILTDLKYTVTARTNAAEALEIFRENPDSVDLLMTDLVMPEMSGRELASYISGLKPNIPIILCSGFCPTIAEDDHSTPGINATINKPIMYNEIVNVLHRVLGQGKDH